MPDPSPERCRAIFEQVADLEPAARADAVRRACAGDEALRRQVDRLLSACDAMGGFLAVTPVWTSGEREYEHVGGYDIVRKVGEGGMGRVYLAEPGPVAVKLIRRDLDPGMVLRRFRRERDILSRLDHPGIARLIDGGSTEDGTLYLVLAYVDGVPLDEFCRDRRSTLRERIDLFRAVCRAVSFAHERLVVHRDLKPANILVTGDGRPVVLDFGLAKLARTSVEQALDSTRTGHRLLTPDYASPEQVKGLRVTAAADVYSLGVMLYELLTGVRPHRFATWSMAEIIEVVCNGDVAPPSVAASAVKASPETIPITDEAAASIQPRELQGALDFVVMKAIAKSPERRYLHVAELDDDLRRYLEGKAIPGSARRTYQT